MHLKRMNLVIKMLHEIDANRCHLVPSYGGKAVPTIFNMSTWYHQGPYHTAWACAIGHAMFYPALQAEGLRGVALRPFTLAPVYNNKYAHEAVMDFLEINFLEANAFFGGGADTPSSLARKLSTFVDVHCPQPTDVRLTEIQQAAPHSVIVTPPSRADQLPVDVRTLPPMPEGDLTLGRPSLNALLLRIISSVVGVAR